MAIRELSELMQKDETFPAPAPQWRLRAVQSEDCSSYIAWNEATREALLIDPKLEDLASYQSIVKTLSGYLWLAVIDTHTHADHVSAAAQIADELSAPLVMHAKSTSERVHLRIARETQLQGHAAPVRLVPTPGHTPDGITVLWGPFIFAGDTLLFGDCGRDDLPGGDPEAHFESIQRIKAIAKPEQILLPGHDHKGGRASSWGLQLASNASLTQDRESFVAEAAAFDAPAPKLLKRSLKENFK